jgi:hypothetical protein
MPNISQKWRKSINIRQNINENPKTILKNPIEYKFLGGHFHVAMRSTGSVLAPFAGSWFCGIFEGTTG